MSVEVLWLGSCSADAEISLFLVQPVALGMTNTLERVTSKTMPLMGSQEVGGVF